MAILVEPTRKERGPRRRHRASSSTWAAGASATRGSEPVAAVGISCGGPLDAAAGVLTAPLHLPDWIDVPHRPISRRAEFGVPAVLENDATAGDARRAPLRRGTRRRHRALSHDLDGRGRGAVIDGRLHRGAAGNGGEFGHVMVRPGGRRCMCGRLGCLEAYASGTSIAARAAKLLAADDRPSTPRAPCRRSRAEHVVGRRCGGRPARRRALERDDRRARPGDHRPRQHCSSRDVVVLGGGVTRVGRSAARPGARDRRARPRCRPRPPPRGSSSPHLGDHVVRRRRRRPAFDLTGGARPCLTGSTGCSCDSSRSRTVAEALAALLPERPRGGAAAHRRVRRRRHPLHLRQRRQRRRRPALHRRDHRPLQAGPAAAARGDADDRRHDVDLHRERLLVRRRLLPAGARRWRAPATSWPRSRPAADPRT